MSNRIEKCVKWGKPTFAAGGTLNGSLQHSRCDTCGHMHTTIEIGNQTSSQIERISVLDKTIELINKEYKTKTLLRVVEEDEVVLNINTYIGTEVVLNWWQ